MTTNKKAVPDYLPRTVSAGDGLLALAIVLWTGAAAWLIWRFYHWLATWTINASRHLNLILMVAVVAAFFIGRATVSKRQQTFLDGMKDGIDTVMDTAEKIGNLRGQLAAMTRPRIVIETPPELPPIPPPRLPAGRGYAGMLGSGDDDVVDGETEEA